MELFARVISYLHDNKDVCKILEFKILKFDRMADIFVISEISEIFLTSTTEGRSGGAVCVFISRLSSFLTSSSFLRLSLTLSMAHF